MGKRSAAGSGSIRQRPDGRWEGRVTLGRDPGTGKQLRRSVYADTQGGVVKAIQKLQSEREAGTHVEPTKLTVSAWMDIWLAEYLGSVKASTKDNYTIYTNRRIKPALGAMKLQKLSPHQIQTFYNGLTVGEDALTAKTVRNIHGILHSALRQAQKIGYINGNPSEMCTLPRVTKRQMKVLDDATVGAFLAAIEGDRYELIYFIDLFTGLRQGEILGLTWDAVDFDAGTLHITRQLVQGNKKRGKYYLDATKTDNIRTITPAKLVMGRLKERQLHQIEHRLKAGPAWSNPLNLVFTNEIGGNYTHNNVYTHYKAIVAGMGMPNLRFHDLRHSYAVASLRAGDDVKVLQQNLGHSTISTTLDVYGHVTEQMKEDSAARMDEYIERIQKNKA